MEILTVNSDKKRSVLRNDIYKNIRLGVVNDYYYSKMTIKKIMEKYSVSRASCYKYIKLYGIPSE